MTRRWPRSARGNRRTSAANTTRSAQSRRGRGLARRRTATSWRSTRSSMSLVADARPSAGLFRAPGRRSSTGSAATRLDHGRPAITAGQRPRHDFWHPTGLTDDVDGDATPVERRSQDLCDRAQAANAATASTLQVSASWISRRTLTAPVPGERRHSPAGQLRSSLRESTPSARSCSASSAQHSFEIGQPITPSSANEHPAPAIGDNPINGACGSSSAHWL